MTSATTAGQVTRELYGLEDGGQPGIPAPVLKELVCTLLLYGSDEDRTTAVQAAELSGIDIEELVSEVLGGAATATIDKVRSAWRCGGCWRCWEEQPARAGKIRCAKSVWMLIILCLSRCWEG